MTGHAGEPWPAFGVPVTDLVAGSLAGGAQVLVGQPLDTIKVRAQTAAVGQFAGPMDVLRQTVRNEGLLALYKGMASPLLGVAAQNSLLFTAFSVSKRLVAADTQLSIPQVALAGSLAGGANALLSSPVELLKIRMQAQYTTHSTAPAPAPAPAPPRLRQVAAHIYSSYGLRRGVMRGFWITVAREVPAYAAFYAAFEAAKAAFRSHLHTDNLPVWALMASGSAGGVANWLACYPLDVVKSRVQLTDHRLAPTYIADEFKAIYRQQGAKAFVRGLSPTLLRAIPAAAATFTTFELAKGLLQGTS